MELWEDLRNEKVYHDEEREGYTPLNEASRRSLNRIFHNMDRFSYIIISASRDKCTDLQNKQRFEKLKKIVKENDYSYIPVKGSFIEDEESDNPVRVYEDSLIVFPIGRKGIRNDNNYKSDEELFNFGLQLIQNDPIQQDEYGNFVGDDPADVECFGQNSFLFKGKDSAPAYFNKEGEKEMSFPGKMNINDKLETYFTQLWKDKGKEGIGKFTFKEACMTAEPLTYSGRHVRYLKGELLNYY